MMMVRMTIQKKLRMDGYGRYLRRLPERKQIHQAGATQAELGGTMYL